MPNNWLSVRQAAEISGYHPKHITRLIHAGKLKAEKFVTVWRVDRKSLTAYLKEMGKRGKKRGPQSGS